MTREYQDKLFFAVFRRGITKLFFPTPLRTALSVIRSAKYIGAGLRCLLHGKIQVPVLDATAITVSMLRGDFETAGSIMFLLGIGDILDEWTHKKSVADLAQSMSLNIDKVWLETDSGSILVPVGEVRPGDCITVGTGGMIPLDGKVVSGEAMVNQATITGEPLAVRKVEGGYVYAGTVVEEGSCRIRVEKSSGGGRYDRIVKMIEESEKLKSGVESHASNLADRLVPYSLGATGADMARDAQRDKGTGRTDGGLLLRAEALHAYRRAVGNEGSEHLSPDGQGRAGASLEAVSQADTFVFDKTGTLTYAAPQVASVIPFNGEQEDEVLRLAACLEEHYPHSMAKAVVAEAERRGLHHEESGTEGRLHSRTRCFKQCGRQEGRHRQPPFCV